MEEENKKRRKAAKRSRAEDVGALVRFVKKRDPRVKARRESSLREQAAKEKERKEQAAQRKKDIAAAKEVGACAFVSLPWPFQIRLHQLFCSSGMENRS